MQETIRQLFPDFEPDLVKEIAAHALLKDIKAGELLMRTGQYFRSTILVVSGLVKVFRENQEGSEYFMYYLEAGQACALSMICAARHEASGLMGKAMADTQVLSIPLALMDSWMSKYKTWYHFVLESYRNRFEDMLQTIDHIAFRNMDERLLYYLQRQQKILKSDQFAISHTEIAHELNSSREVISRLVKKLAEQGKIRLLKNQQIEIIQLTI